MTDPHKYDSILHAMHRQSKTRPHMSMEERAAQFSPYAALSGYDAVIQETERLTVLWEEPGEDEKALLSRKCQYLLTRISERPFVRITFFKMDEMKEGGTFITIEGALRRIDTVSRQLILEDGTHIPMEYVRFLEGDIFGDDPDSFGS